MHKYVHIMKALLCEFLQSKIPQYICSRNKMWPLLHKIPWRHLLFMRVRCDILFTLSFRVFGGNLWTSYLLSGTTDICSHGKWTWPIKQSCQLYPISPLDTAAISSFFLESYYDCHVVLAHVVSFLWSKIKLLYPTIVTTFGRVLQQTLNVFFFIQEAWQQSRVAQGPPQYPS